MTNCIWHWLWFSWTGDILHFFPTWFGIPWVPFPLIKVKIYFDITLFFSGHILAFQDCYAVRTVQCCKSLQVHWHVRFMNAFFHYWILNFIEFTMVVVINIGCSKIPRKARRETHVATRPSVVIFCLTQKLFERKDIFRPCFAV